MQGCSHREIQDERLEGRLPARTTRRGRCGINSHVALIDYPTNLIRLLMAQAALLADQIPRQLSFKHTVQLWISWQSRGGGTHDAVCIRALLVLIAEPRVGLRPGRIEPRALKRRLKHYPLLTKPRRLAQEHVRQHGHPKKQR